MVFLQIDDRFYKIKRQGNNKNQFNIVIGLSKWIGAGRSHLKRRYFRLSTDLAELRTRPPCPAASIFPFAGNRPKAWASIYWNNRLAAFVPRSDALFEKFPWIEPPKLRCEPPGPRFSTALCVVRVRPPDEFSNHSAPNINCIDSPVRAHRQIMAKHSLGIGNASLE